MKWTEHEGPGLRWTLDAAPRYAVEEYGCGYVMLIDGREVDNAETPEQARALLETRFEYEEHAADLELARLRLRQVRTHLTARYPRAAKDPELSCILEGLEDAIGRGPEASDPAELDALTGEVFRVRIVPDLSVVVDGSQCITLEVTDGDGGRVLRRPTVTAVDYLKGVLGEARKAQQAVLAEADAARYCGPDEARRARGQLTKSEAVEWLIARPMSRQRAVHVAADLRAGAAGGSFTDGMTYDGTYWVVPAEEPQP